MPQFTINQPQDVLTPVVEVLASFKEPLPAGEHLFQLVVEDDHQMKSDPKLFRVVVLPDTRRPTVDIEGPAEVPFGTPFKLVARATLVDDHQIKVYHWMLTS